MVDVLFVVRRSEKAVLRLFFWVGLESIEYNGMARVLSRISKLIRPRLEGIVQIWR